MRQVGFRLAAVKVKSTLIDILQKLLKLFGVNRAIGFGVLTRVWGALAGPVTILLIATRFTKVEQGYYYTFSSLLALQVFFELGLLTVLAQFAAHEFAFLSWSEKGEITGSEAHRDRFVDLLGKGFKWYTVSALLLILILIPAGFLFFTQSPGNVVDFSWRLPWALAVIGVGCNLLLIPFYAVITGSGEVASINRREMMGGMAGSIIGWLVIACGGGLYAIPAVTSGTILVGVIYLSRSKPRLVKTAFTHAFGSVRTSHTLSWWGEVWPMQWKIAISWVSGYFIFQLFTPVLFKFHGPVVAGQMGMTLSIWNAILATCATWMTVKGPFFGKLIATKSWRELDGEFYRVLKQSVIVTLGITSLALAVIYTVQQSYNRLGERLIPTQFVLFMFAALLAQVIINGFAVYLRAHKQEPFLYLSICGAVLQAVCVVVIGKMYSYQGITVVFALMNTLFIFPAYMIWMQSRREWHEV
jgi:O-antigen/teichoic acid export membrane protein